VASVVRAGAGVPNDLMILAGELHRPDLDGELVELAREAEGHLIVLVVNGVRVSTPTSKVSSIAMMNGMVCGILLVATSLPSTFSTPVSPLPKPGPSYLKSNTMVCSPGASASWPSHRSAASLPLV
jgi:hypothetical protein